MPGIDLCLKIGATVQQGAVERAKLLDCRGQPAPECAGTGSGPWQGLSDNKGLAFRRNKKTLFNDALCDALTLGSR
jgi:hypothetical protein